MDTLKAIEAEESRKEEQRNLHATRKAMAATLNAQMAVEQVRHRQLQKEDADYLAQQQRMLNEWKREQNFADEIIHMKNLQMKKIRQEQIDEKVARKAKEQQDNRAKELRDIAKCQRELQKEKEVFHLRKEEERKRLEAIKAENLQREKLVEVRAGERHHRGLGRGAVAYVGADPGGRVGGGTAAAPPSPGLRVDSSLRARAAQVLQTKSLQDMYVTLRAARSRRSAPL
jgi:superfamily II DNA helicase RecQ